MFKSQRVNKANEDFCNILVTLQYAPTILIYFYVYVESLSLLSSVHCRGALFGNVDAMKYNARMRAQLQRSYVWHP